MSERIDMPRKLRNVRKYSFEEIKDSEELIDQEFVLEVDFDENLDDVESELRYIMGGDKKEVLNRLVELARKLQ